MEPQSKQNQDQPTPADCPATCPNRVGQGIVIFGWRIDPVELMLHLFVLILLGFPAAKNAAKDDFTPRQAIEWLGAIVGASTLVRLSPTDRVNAYLNLTK